MSAIVNKSIPMLVDLMSPVLYVRLLDVLDDQQLIVLAQERLGECQKPIAIELDEL